MPTEDEYICCTEIGAVRAESEIGDETIFA